MDTSLFWFALASFSLAWVIKWIWWRRSHHLPPGPWGLPLLGYMPFMSKSFTKDCQMLKEKYGRIFGLSIGSKYTVVVNDFQDIREAFNKKEFLGRPPGLFQFHDKYKHLGTMNGWEWKETRKLFVRSLAKLGIGKDRVEQIIKEQVRQLIISLDSITSENESNTSELTHLPLLNVILSILCGANYEKGEHFEETVKQASHEIIQEVASSLTRMYIPFLKPFSWLKKAFQSEQMPSVREMENFARTEIDRHIKQYDENNLEDFIDHYIKEMRSAAHKKTSLTYENMIGNVQTLQFVGTDTTGTSLSWIFLYLAHYKEAQEKMHEEIVCLLGKENPPSWVDRKNLPYTKAFILEVSRHKTLGPVADPHWSLQEGTIGGFYIPKDTTIIANLEAVHQDTTLWGDAENFRPERFLSDDGNTVSVPVHWIPFHIGKRMCPGMKLANMQLFLIVSSLVQKFEILAPRSGLSLEAEDKGIILPIKPVVCFRRRV